MPKALKTWTKSNKPPNLVTLVPKFMLVKTMWLTSSMALIIGSFSGSKPSDIKIEEGSSIRGKERSLEMMKRPNQLNTFNNVYVKCELISSGCGAVGRAVTHDTRDPRFESSHRQFFTINCIEKTKTKIKEARNGRFKKYDLDQMQQFWRNENSDLKSNPSFSSQTNAWEGNLS